MRVVIVAMWMIDESRAGTHRTDSRNLADCAHGAWIREAIDSHARMR